jgi:hypothetical protein
MFTMIRPHMSRGARAGTAAALVLGLSGFALLMPDLQPFKKIPLGNEKELKATIEGGLADVTIARGTASTILNAEMAMEDNESPRGTVDYAARGGIGYVSVDLSPDEWEDGKGRKKERHMSIHSSTWKLLYTDAIPISFDIELGLGEADIDMSGLNVRDFDLSTGASSVRLAFNEPNKGSIETMSVEAGLSKFKAMGLGNANFRRLNFEGGVGKYTLDFHGNLKKEIDVDAEVGLGSLTIVIPSNIGARIIYEKNWICDLDIDSEFAEQDDNTYQTANYATAAGRINLRVEAGFGGVNIRRD